MHVIAPVKLSPSLSHQEGFTLRVYAQGKVKVHGGQHSVDKVHDPNQTVLMQCGVDWGHVDVDIGSRNCGERNQNSRP